MQIFDSKAIDYLMKLFRGSGDGNIVVNHDSSDPSRIRAKNNDGSIDLLVQNGGERGIYDSTANNEGWLIRTDGTDTYLPKGDVKIPGVVDPQTQALSGGNLETAGKVTANGGLETSSISASGGLYIQGDINMEGNLTVTDGVLTVDNEDAAATHAPVYIKGSDLYLTQSNPIPDPNDPNATHKEGGNLDCNTVRAFGLEIYHSSSVKASIDTYGNIAAHNVSASNELYSEGNIDVNGYIYNSDRNATTVNINQDLDVKGDAYADNFTQHSDERLKDIQGDVKLTIDDFANAPSVLFKFKNRKDEKLHGGTIAQYWQKIAPWAVSEDKDGYLSVSYANLALAGVIAIARFLKQYLTRLVKVENELAEMKKEMQQLRSKVNG